MVRPDWTIAMDDALCERFPACLECGQRAQRLDTLLIGGRVLLASRCTKCYAKDREATELIARLARRH